MNNESNESNENIDSRDSRDSRDSSLPGIGPSNIGEPTISGSTEKEKNLWQRISALSALSSVVLGLVAASIAFLEWDEQKDIRRKERTLTYIDSFEDPAGGLSEQRRVIRAFFKVEESNLTDLTARMANTIPEMHSTVLGNFMRNAAERFESDGTVLLDAVDDVIFHLDSVDLCICSGTCDSELGIQGFGDFAISILWWFGWHLAESREHALQYGLGLEKIATTYASQSNQMCTGQNCVSWDLDGDFRCEYEG